MKNIKDRHFLNACHWQHGLSTADNDAVPAGLEIAIMTRFNLSNGFTLDNWIASTKLYKPRDSRKIHRGKCSGANRNSSTCDVVPLWIRIRGFLVLRVYVSAGINIKATLDIRHSPECIRTKSAVPFDVTQQAIRGPHPRNKARRWLQDYAISEDSSMRESLLNKGININSASDRKKVFKAISNQDQKEKKKQKRVTEASRKPFAFDHVLKLINEHFMHIDEFCEHASDDEFIRANFDRIVVLEHDVATKDDMRCSGFVFTTIGRLCILSNVIKMYEWKKGKHLGISAITMQIDGLVIFNPDTLKGVPSLIICSSWIDVAVTHKVTSYKLIACSFVVYGMLLCNSMLLCNIRQCAPCVLI